MPAIANAPVVIDWPVQPCSSAIASARSLSSRASGSGWPVSGAAIARCARQPSSRKGRGIRRVWLRASSRCCRASSGRPRPLDEAAGHLRVARGLAAAVPAQRRRLFDVYLAFLDVELARRHSDLSRAQEATRGLEAALGAAAETNELPVPPDYRALVLINLGIAELWAGRPDDARQHLEDALSHTRRIPRPFLELGCLAHLAIAAPLTGQPLPLASS